MSLPPWRSPLAGALHRNRSLVYARYVQLATIRPDGRPANRTIVFRGFLQNTDQLMFTTDCRSEKAQQIQEASWGDINWGELCWYFPKTREQFRLLGSLTLIKAEEQNSEFCQARLQLWSQLSDAARTQFAWADPGKPRSPEDGFNPSPPDPTIPLATFCLLLLDPTQVDHLELRGEPQNRYRYSKDSQQTWSVESVNP